MKYTDIESAYLHDYEISDIQIMYKESIINVNLISPKGEKSIVKILDFINQEIVRNEPWGSGMYIFSFKFNYFKQSNYYKLHFLLNSGDYLDITTKEKPILIEIG